MALSFVNAFLEWAHDVLPDGFSCWHSTGPGSTHYKEIFFRGLVFSDEMALLVFTVHKQKTHLKFQGMIQQDIFFATYPFVKHVDLRQVGLTMSNKKA